MIIGKKNSVVRIKKISTNLKYYVFVPDGFEKICKLMNSIEKGYNLIAITLEEELILLFAGLVVTISKTEEGFYKVETETAFYEIQLIKE